jgi:hypothetical protein
MVPHITHNLDTFYLYFFKDTNNVINNVPKKFKCVITVGAENAQHHLKITIHPFYSVSCELLRYYWWMPTAASSLSHLRSSRFFKW